MLGDDRSAGGVARPRRARLLLVAVLVSLVGRVLVATPGSAETPPAEGKVETRVVNGDLASSSEYPFYAAIVDRDEADPFQAQFCGGAIVGARLVLTAAHCVDSLDPVDVIVGTDRLAPGRGTRIEVDAITVHPDWDAMRARNDLALLHLASATAQRPVAVVPAASDFRWAAGSTAHVVGFGCTSYDNTGGYCTKYPDRLYDAPLPVGSDSWCADVLGADFHAGTMLCAGSTSVAGEASDACFGDSGGPLVVAGAGGWSSPLLVGLVSWGPGCGNSPSAYSRLAEYRGWLKSHGVPITRLFTTGPGLSVGGSYTPVAGDFDGDGRDDVLWYAPGSGTDVLWRGRAGSFRRDRTVTVNGRYTPVAGDFDGDGRDDILWYAPGPGPDVLWRGTASGFRRAASVTVGGVYTPLVGDFDGDGRDDILWYAPGPGTDVLWRGTASSFRRDGTVTVNGRYTPVVGDFDGDGRDDILWYAPGAGTDALWRGRASGFRTAVTWQQGGTFWPQAGDFDGDGYDDIVWYAWGGGHDLVWRGAHTKFAGRYDQQLPDLRLPVLGDFNGDGNEDLVLYGPGSAPESHLRGTG